MACHFIQDRQTRISAGQAEPAEITLCFPVFYDRPEKHGILTAGMFFLNKNRFSAGVKRRIFLLSVAFSLRKRSRATRDICGYRPLSRLQPAGRNLR